MTPLTQRAWQLDAMLAQRLAPGMLVQIQRRTDATERIGVQQQHPVPARAAAAARLIAVVVLPTPPFWLATRSFRTAVSTSSCRGNYPSPSEQGLSKSLGHDLPQCAGGWEKFGDMGRLNVS